MPMLTQSKSRLLVCGVVRSFSTSPRVLASHYDVLGITPKATQSDIKAAYYKLSKMYHPDLSPLHNSQALALVEKCDVMSYKIFDALNALQLTPEAHINADEAAAKKFRAITEAYEVLGNINLKKMYDKGLIVGKENTRRMDWQPDPEPMDPAAKFYKARENRNITPTMDGRTPIYNYDAWSKEHYGAIFEKAKYDKNLLRKKQLKKENAVESSRQEALLYLVFAVTGLFMVLVINGQSDYDMDRTKARQKREESQKQE